MKAGVSDVMVIHQKAGQEDRIKDEKKTILNIDLGR